MTEAVIRIVGTHLPGRVCGPHREVSVGLQVGKEVVQVVPGDADGVVWEATVTVGRAKDGALMARGPAVHGPRTERFLYLAWLGSTGGAIEMFRRAKLQFDGVPAEVFDLVVATRRPLVGALGLTDKRMAALCSAVHLRRGLQGMGSPWPALRRRRGESRFNWGGTGGVPFTTSARWVAARTKGRAATDLAKTAMTMRQER